MDTPPRLEGRLVTLEPLLPEHAEALVEALSPDDDVWTHMTSAPGTADEMRAWIEARRTPRNGLQALPFLQREPSTGRAMGSTTLFDIDLAMESAEIGFTWLARPFRGTGANAEAKLLLLTHAFETLGLRRVQLMTDARNERSQRAMARLGFSREGVLRNYRRRRDGTLRDSVVYSVIDKEWPEVRAAIEKRLA